MAPPFTGLVFNMVSPRVDSEIRVISRRRRVKAKSRNQEGRSPLSCFATCGLVALLKTPFMLLSRFMS
jgi:hypothetical protein